MTVGQRGLRVGARNDGRTGGLRVGPAMTDGRGTLRAAGCRPYKIKKFFLKSSSKIASSIVL